MAYEIKMNESKISDSETHSKKYSFFLLILHRMKNCQQTLGISETVNNYMKFNMPYVVFSSPPQLTNN